jgi:predicted DsbA family dithiol-disulfide isomerase
VRLTWRSYQLDPGVHPLSGKSITEYLAERKGVTRDSSEAMHAQLEKSAAELGLSYHLARSKGMQEKMQERLFAAYFTEGRDIGDAETLVGLGTDPKS